MSGDVSLRNATAADAHDLAYLHALASGGIVEFVFEDVVPGVGPIELFAEAFAHDKGPYTWRNCVVADDGRQVVGKLHSFPADEEAEHEPDPRIPVERFEVLAPLETLKATGTWYICAVAVRPGNQGRGLGKQFMELANDQARKKGFTELSLHVFEDNRGAVALYQSLAFQITNRCTLKHKAFSHHEGDLLLMRRPVY